MWRLFTDKRFVLLWGSQVISQVGDGFGQIAVLLLVATQLTTGPLGISLILLADLGPAILLSPVAGAIGDRKDKKMILMTSDVARAILFGIIVITWHWHSLLTVVILMVLVGSFRAFFSPAKTAAIPQLLGDDKITDAIGFSQATSAVTSVVGVGLGGLAVGLFGTQFALIVDGASFLLSAMLVMFLPRLLSERTHSRHSIIADTREGISTVRNAPILTFLLVILMPVTLSLGIFTTTQNSILLQDLHLTPSLYGYTEAVYSAGAAAGALLGAFLLKRLRAGSILLFGVLGTGLMFMAIVPISDYYIILGGLSILSWALLLGIASTLIQGPLSTLFVLATPKQTRARGAALMQAVINTCMLLGTLLGGLVGAFMGAIPLTLLSGAVLVITAAVGPFARGFKQLQLRAKFKSQSVNQPEGTVV